MSQLPESLRKDLKSLQAAIDAVVEAPKVNQASIDRIYALLHNSKVNGEQLDFKLISSICALACGILQRARAPDESTWRAVKAHVDALAIIVDHNLAGDGGELGRRMVDELRGLAKAAGA